MDTTYKIIGGDGAEYGPATLEELRDWIRDGRVAGMTQVWRNDLAEWLPATRYSELGPELARLHATVAVAARPCGFWARFAAYVVDAFLISILFQVVWMLLPLSLNWPLPALPTTFNDDTIKQFILDCQKWADHAILIYYPVCVCYDILLNGRFGATIGKMAIGARIVLLDGSPIGYGWAAVRSAISRVIELAFLPAYLVVAFRRDKRGLHDLMAGTRVIYKI